MELQNENSDVTIQLTREWSSGFWLRNISITNKIIEDPEFYLLWLILLVNHSPNITMETNYYVVYRENFKLPIEAVDPEGMPVTVSLMGGSPKKAMIRNNVLYWNVTTNQTTQFFFKATDACQASSTFNMTITVVPCPCNNSGQCVPQEPRGQRNYRCHCAAGYIGQYCSAEIDECASYPCLRGTKSKIIYL